MKISALRFIPLLLLIKTSGYCQSTGETIEANTIVIGTNEETQNDITAKEYTFNDRIDDIYLNKQSNNVTLQIRGTSKNGKWLDNNGAIVLFDLDNHKQMWSRKINFQNQVISQYGNTIISNSNISKTTSQGLNIGSGKEWKELKHKVYYVDTASNISIGYIVKASGVSYNLVGVDLKDISLQWERELKRDYYWDGLRYLNDSTLLVSAAGLHTVDINTGKGWDYNTVTGTKDYTRATITTVAGVALGVLTGTYFYSGDPDLLHGIFSNSVEDSNSFYYASKECLARIHKSNGYYIWKIPFEEDEASHSNLFIVDDKLIMVNLGYAYLDNRAIDYGKPFIAGFDKETGKKLFFTSIGDKKNPIKGVMKKGGNLCLLFNDSIALYNINDGVRIVSNTIKKNKDEDLLYFLGYNLYHNTGDSLHPIFKPLDTTKIYFYSNKNTIYEVASDLSFSKTIKLENAYLSTGNLGNLKLINQKNETYILDKNDKIVAKLKASHQAVLKNNILYDFAENKLIEVNLNDFASY